MPASSVLAEAAPRRARQRRPAHLRHVRPATPAGFCLAAASRRGCASTRRAEGARVLLPTYAVGQVFKRARCVAVRVRELCCCGYPVRQRCPCPVPVDASWPCREEIRTVERTRSLSCWRFIRQSKQAGVLATTSESRSSLGATHHHRTPGLRAGWGTKPLPTVVPCSVLDVAVRPQIVFVVE